MCQLRAVFNTLSQVWENMKKMVVKIDILNLGAIDSEIMTH